MLNATRNTFSSSSEKSSSKIINLSSKSAVKSLPNIDTSSNVNETSRVKSKPGSARKGYISPRKKQIAINTSTDMLWTDTIALESDGRINLNVNKILTQDLRTPISNQDSSMPLTSFTSMSSFGNAVIEKLPSNLDQITAVNNFSWSNKLKENVVKSLSRSIDEDKAYKYLRFKNWPNGLISTLIKAYKKIPLRFFVIDDSGSMTRYDGKKLSKSGLNTKIVECSRWSELTDSMKFIAELSEEIQAPSDFRLLNGADPVMIGLGDDDREGIKFLNEVFEEKPLGQTPLCIHIINIVKIIESIAPILKQNNQKVAIIIATDGLATDGSVVEALRPIQKLPVWLVIRLCTNEADVVKFWNNIDKELEIELDVLDDFFGESLEVRKVNPWLHYGEPLHRLREFGVPMKEIDMIDEKKLTSEQMRDICRLVLSDGNLEIPHPEISFKDFITKLKQLNNKKTFDSISTKMKPWINIAEIKEIYGSKVYTGFTCNIS